VFNPDYYYYYFFTWVDVKYWKRAILLDSHLNMPISSRFAGYYLFGITKKRKCNTKINR